MEACRKVVHNQLVVVEQDKDTVAVVAVAGNMARDIFSYNDEHRLVDTMLEVLVVHCIRVGQGDPYILGVQVVPCILVGQAFQGIQEVPSFQVDLALVVAEVADSTGAEMADILHRTCWD